MPSRQRFAIVLFTLVTTTFLVARGNALPPPPEDEAAYAPGASSYATVDARESASVNAHAMRWASTGPASPLPAGVPAPMDLPPRAEASGAVANCSAPGTQCLAFLGVAVSLSRQVKPEIGARWQSGPWSFEVKACTTNCTVRMIHFSGAEGRGWYAWSPHRGVEAFAREDRNGVLGSTFFLTSDDGLLGAHADH